MKSTNYAYILSVCVVGVISFFSSVEIEKSVQSTDINVSNSDIVRGAEEIVNFFSDDLIDKSTVNIGMSSIGTTPLDLFNILCKDYYKRHDIIRVVQIYRVKPHEIDLESELLSELYGTQITVRPIDPFSNLTSGEDDLWVSRHAYPEFIPVIGLELSSDKIRGVAIDKALSTSNTSFTSVLSLIDTGEDGILSFQPVIDIHGEVNSIVIIVFNLELLFNGFLDTHGRGLDSEFFLDGELIFDKYHSSDNGESISYNVDRSGINFRAVFSIFTFEKYRHWFWVPFVLFFCILCVINIVILLLYNSRKNALSSSLYKTQFVSNVSHEIRTPMNGILGATELLSHIAIPQEGGEYIATIKSCGLILMSIINNVLDMSKLEAGIMEVSYESISIIENLEYMSREAWFSHRSISNFSHTPVETLIVISKNVPEIVSCDIGKIRQILSNLITNSLKFTNIGSVCIHVDAKEKDPENVYLLFKIIDTGIGIDTNNLSIIFNSFSQVHRDRRYGGTGLGLAISKQLCEIMGGTLTCTSVLGEGTTFSFDILVEGAISTTHSERTSVFKLSSSEYVNISRNVSDSIHDLSFDVHNHDIENEIKIENTGSHLPIDHSPIDHSPIVLIVDDVQVNRRILHNMLARYGIRAETCENGLSSIDMCKVKKYSIIFMDLVMPIMGGIEATRILKKDGGLNQTTPILFVSASVSENSRNKSISSGGDGFVTKPYTEKNIIDSIRLHMTEDEIKWITENSDVFDSTY